MKQGQRETRKQRREIRLVRPLRRSGSLESRYTAYENHKTEESYGVWKMNECPICSGNKAVACWVCHGKRKVTCSTCSGGGRTGGFLSIFSRPSKGALAQEE